MHPVFKSSLLRGKWTSRILLPAVRSLGGPRAAINVVYRRLGRSPDILLVKRRVSPYDPWSGDVGFPGGGVKGRESPWQAAMRETFEEVGIPPSKLVLEASLGEEGTLALPGLRVHVYLSRLIGDPVLKVNKYELVGAWWVPVSSLRGPSRLFHVFKGRVVEAYVFDGGLVWGLSKRVLDRVLGIL